MPCTKDVYLFALLQWRSWKQNPRMITKQSCWSVTSRASCLSKGISLTCNTRYIKIRSRTEHAHSVSYLPLWLKKNGLVFLDRDTPYPDGVYTPAWSVHSKATLLPLPLECTLQPHSEYHRCTLGFHSMDFVKSLTNRNTLQRHFKCTPGGVYTPLPLI